MLYFLFSLLSKFRITHYRPLLSVCINTTLVPSVVLFPFLCYKPVEVSIPFAVSDQLLWKLSPYFYNWIISVPWTNNYLLHTNKKNCLIAANYSKIYLRFVYSFSIYSEQQKTIDLMKYEPLPNIGNNWV